MLTPLSILLTAYPLLWFLGLDGFAWMVLLPVAGLLTFRQRTPISPRLFAFILGCTLLVAGAIVAAFWIEERVRYLTWFRDLYLIMTLVVVTWYLANCESERLQSRILKPIASILLFSCLLGVLAITFSDTLNRETPAASMMPDILAATDFGRRLVNKQIATEGYFAGEPYLRLSGTFDYATSYGAVLASFCVYVLAGWMSFTGSRIRWVLAGMMPIVLFSLAYTTARTSILALCLGILTMAMLWGNTRTRILLGLLVVGCVIALAPLLTELILLRGEGSATVRFEIYQRTAEAIAAHPLGYGTQTDVEGLRFPLGSHSTWLALPYKYGVVGSLGMILILLSLFRNRIFGVQHVNVQAAALSVTLFTIAIFEELYLDAMGGLVIACLLGAALAEHRISNRQPATDSRPVVRQC